MALQSVNPATGEPIEAYEETAPEQVAAALDRAQATFEEWRRVARVNFDGLFLMCKAGSDLMRKNNYGRIVNFGSNSILAGTPNMAHYVATKGAVFSFGRALATELGAYKITVNTVMPGPTRSEGIVDFLKSVSPQAKDAAEAEAEFFRVHRSSSLLQRLIDPKEIAHMVAYLASPLSAATNGAALRVEGGLLRSIV